MRLSRSVAAFEVVEMLQRQSEEISDVRRMETVIADRLAQSDESIRETGDELRDRLATAMSSLIERIRGSERSSEALVADFLEMGRSIAEMSDRVLSVAAAASAAGSEASVANTSVIALEERMDHDVSEFDDRVTALESGLEPMRRRVSSLESDQRRQDEYAAANEARLHGLESSQDAHDVALRGKASIGDLESKADNSQLAEKADRSDLSRFATKDSPGLTGTPTAPTPAKGDSSGLLATTEFVGREMASRVDRIEILDMATTAFVRSELAKLIGGATPSTLDTLQEIAEALGNDPQLASHLASQIAAKQDRSAILTILAGLVLAEGAMIYATGSGAVSTTSSTPFGRSLLALPDGPAARNAIGAAAASDIVAIQRARLTTAVDGMLTWNFPKAYPVGVVPVVSCEVEGGGIRPFVVQLVSVTNAQVVVKAFRIIAAKVTVLGGLVEVYDAPGAITIHLVAIPPA